MKLIHGLVALSNRSRVFKLLRDYFVVNFPVLHKNILRLAEGRAISRITSKSDGLPMNAERVHLYLSALKGQRIE